MDHGGQFGMEDSVISQETELCDSLVAASVNLNDLVQIESRLALKNENGGKQVSTLTDPFNNNDEQDKNVCTGQIEEDQDEVMKEDEDEFEESSFICFQSPDTPMTDSSYSETGSLQDTPYGFSPGTSPEPVSPVPLMEASEKQSHSSALDSCYGDTKILSAEKLASGSEQYTSTEETFSDHEMPLATGPGAVLCKQSEQNSLSLPTSSSAGKESSSELIGTTAITMNQETLQLLGFLDQLAKRGDDTYFPQYLHQIAEAFVSHEDYQRAVWCIQLEQLYHQRLLDNLCALQKQWETRCNTASPALTSQHLDTLKHICQTHNRPKASDAVCSLDPAVVPSCSFGRMAQLELKEGPSLPSSNDRDDKIDSSEVKGREWEDYKSERTDSFHPAQPDEKEGSERKGDETEGGLACTMLAEGDGVSPSVIDNMDQSKTAEQQGGGPCPAQEQEADPVAERDVEEATEALDMEDEDEAEEEGHNGKAFTFSPETLPVETVVSAAAVEIRQQETKSEEKETQFIPEDTQGTEMNPPEEYTRPQGVEDVVKEEEEEEEEEEDYEVEPADLIRAAATLDNLAKLITVEEMVPAPGLVSILKKSKEVENPIPATPEPKCKQLPVKRRVRFKVPDDGFDSDMGGGDSCLLLFLLCLVTVVISIGGTALYCALGDTHSSVCQDFSRNADFYIGQIQWGITQIQHWFTPTS